MNAENFEYYLMDWEPCDNKGFEWARGKTLAEAWTGCHRADWMLGFCGQAPYETWPNPKRVVLTAFACIGTGVWHTNSKLSKPEEIRDVHIAVGNCISSYQKRTHFVNVSFWAREAVEAIAKMSEDPDSALKEMADVVRSYIDPPPYKHEYEKRHKEEYYDHYGTEYEDEEIYYQ